jgi:protein-S-isoprenylcysteine O-methyltransferase Ste14
MRSIFLIIRMLVYAALAFFMWRFVAIMALRFDANFHFTLPGWTALAGVPVISAGIVLTVVCFVEFALIGKGTFVHFDPPKEFVAAGVYRYSRNPMYVGVLLIFIGSALIYRSISLLSLACLLFALAHVVVVMVEEPALANKFGDSYIQYKRSVCRWFPRLK